MQFRRAASLLVLVGIACVIAPSPASAGSVGPGIKMKGTVTVGENVTIQVWCNEPAVYVSIGVDEALSNGFVIQSSPQPFGGIHYAVIFHMTVQDFPGFHTISATCLPKKKDLGFPLGNLPSFPDYFGPKSFKVIAADGGGGGGGGGPGGSSSGSGTPGSNGDASAQFDFSSLFGQSLDHATVGADLIFQSLLFLLSPPPPPPPPTTTPPTTAGPPTSAPSTPSTAPSTEPSSTTTSTTDPNAPCPPNCKP